MGGIHATDAQIEAIRTAAVDLVVGAADTARLTLADVAKQAGVGEALVRNLYLDEADLIRDVQLRGFTACLARMDLAVTLLPPGATALEELRALATGYVEFAMEDPKTYMLIYGIRNAMSTGLARIDEGAHPGAQALDTLIAGVEVCRPDLSPAVVRERSIGLWLALHGFVRMRCDRPLLALPSTSQLVRTLVEAAAGPPGPTLRLVADI